MPGRGDKSRFVGTRGALLSFCGLLASPRARVRGLEQERIESRELIRGPQVSAALCSSYRRCRDDRKNDKDRVREWRKEAERGKKQERTFERLVNIQGCTRAPVPNYSRVRSETEKRSNKFSDRHRDLEQHGVTECGFTKFTRPTCKSQGIRFGSHEKKGQWYKERMRMRSRSYA